MKKRSLAPARIRSVRRGSPAEACGLLAGDLVYDIDGAPMRDAIDFMSLLSDPGVHLLGVARSGEMGVMEIDCSRGEPGIALDSPVFDGVRTCGNNCLFCFVDQLPAGLRPDLYIKDDDYRLSFLCGNFITLTNLEKSDIRRIIALRLSPLYVSVHATAPSVRKKMFGNPDAPTAMRAMRELLNAGLTLHLQIVLMRGVNDGPEFDRTLEDLSGRYAGARTVGVVPVGIASHGRESLSSGFAFDPESSSRLIEQVDRARPGLAAGGTLLCAADEFYHIAASELPASEYYGDFEQLENGIGIARLFRDEYEEASGGLPPLDLSDTVILTTEAGAWGLAPLGIEESGARISICANSLFGDRVDVCGLMSGKDAASCLANAGKAAACLVPGVALDDRGVFIDGVPLDLVAEGLKTRIRAVPATGAALAAEIHEEREEM